MSIRIDTSKIQDRGRDDRLRETALYAAVNFWSGPGADDASAERDVAATADTFLDWLREGDEQTAPEGPPPTPAVASRNIFGIGERDEFTACIEYPGRTGMYLHERPIPGAGYEAVSDTTQATMFSTWGEAERALRSVRRDLDRLGDRTKVEETIYRRTLTTSPGRWEKV